MERVDDTQRKTANYNKLSLSALAMRWYIYTNVVEAAALEKEIMRDVVETHFHKVVSQLNRELEIANTKYWFDETPHAGYTAEGPLEFGLWPNLTEEFEDDDDLVRVDFGRAKELTSLINSTDAVKAFLSVFPHVKISVESNYNGTLVSVEEFYQEHGGEDVPFDEGGGGEEDALVD